MDGNEGRLKTASSLFVLFKSKFWDERYGNGKAFWQETG